MTDRRIEALRRLAERPGTEAEGIVAREMLRRAETKQEQPKSSWEYFEHYLRTSDPDDLAKAVQKRCPCGAAMEGLGACQDHPAHWQIRAAILGRFPVKTRVYYNAWAYPPNDPGHVCGRSNTHWNCLRVRFDRLRSPISIPVYDNGWKLFIEPIEYDKLRSMNIRGGMENIEDLYERTREG